jgi:hypothetical protein
MDAYLLAPALSEDDRARNGSSSRIATGKRDAIDQAVC